jgi:hypothetical protein
VLVENIDQIISRPVVPLEVLLQNPGVRKMLRSMKESGCTDEQIAVYLRICGGGNLTGRKMRRPPTGKSRVSIPRKAILQAIHDNGNNLLVEQVYPLLPGAAEGLVDRGVDKAQEAGMLHYGLDYRYSVTARGLHYLGKQEMMPTLSRQKAIDLLRMLLEFGDRRLARTYIRHGLTTEFWIANPDIKSWVDHCNRIAFLGLSNVDHRHYLLFKILPLFVEGAGRPYFSLGDLTLEGRTAAETNEAIFVGISLSIIKEAGYGWQMEAVKQQGPYLDPSRRRYNKKRR